MNIKILGSKKIIISLLLLAVTTVGFTIAYYMSATQQLTNTFEIKTIESHIDEPDVTIGSGVINKAPKVVLDEDSGDAIVRVKIVISPENMITIGNENANIQLNSNWYDGDDGYYYYNGILSCDNEQTQSTTPVFEQITGVIVTDDEGNSHFAENYSNFEVTIYQETVQTAIGNYDLNGEYNKEIAEAIWNYYDSRGNVNNE